MSGRSARSQGLDLEYRPPSSWETPGPVAAVRSAIKGQNRRQLFTDFVAGELGSEVEQLEPELLAESLDEGTRRMLGRLHPHWMGGEYLPNALPGEVEIARIVLQSVTQDVISIRARRRRGGRRIFYRIVDEYGDDPDRGAWRCRPASSAAPLSLGQVIALIEGAEDPDFDGHPGTLPDRLRDMQEGADPEDVVGFVNLESAFYPTLATYFERDAAAWLRSKRRELS